MGEAAEAVEVAEAVGTVEEIVTVMMIAAAGTAAIEGERGVVAAKTATNVKKRKKLMRARMLIEHANLRHRRAAALSWLAQVIDDRLCPAYISISQRKATGV